MEKNSAAEVEESPAQPGNRKVGVSFPEWMLKVIDDEATRLGISRDAMVKVWIASKIEKLGLFPERNEKSKGQKN